MGTKSKERALYLSRTSVLDDRPSAAYVGYVAISVVTSLLGIIVLLDIVTAARHFKNCPCKKAKVPKATTEFTVPTKKFNVNPRASDRLRYLIENTGDPPLTDRTPPTDPHASSNSDVSAEPPIDISTTADDSPAIPVPPAAKLTDVDFEMIEDYSAPSRHSCQDDHSPNGKVFWTELSGVTIDANPPSPTLCVHSRLFRKRNNYELHGPKLSSKSDLSEKLENNNKHANGSITKDSEVSDHSHDQATKDRYVLAYGYDFSEKNTANPSERIELH